MYLSLLFYFIASIAVGSAIFVVLNRNAIYSAVSLVLCFFALAVLYLLLEAYFLAVLEIFIYAGAIMVLFLFAIMLLNLGREEALPRFMQLQRSLSLMLVLIFFFGIFLILFACAVCFFVNTLYKDKYTLKYSCKVMVIISQLSISILNYY